MRIYCPKCEYAPTATDRWMCLPGCHAIWNTFETGGRCPQCARQWRETCCPRCHRWSPHEDWYHEEDTDAATDDAVEELEQELAGVGAGEEGPGWAAAAPWKFFDQPPAPAHPTGNGATPTRKPRR